MRISSIVLIIIIVVIFCLSSNLCVKASAENYNGTKITIDVCKNNRTINTIVVDMVFIQEKPALFIPVRHIVNYTAVSSLPKTHVQEPDDKPPRI